MQAVVDAVVALNSNVRTGTAIKSLAMVSMEIGNDAIARSGGDLHAAFREHEYAKAEVVLAMVFRECEKRSSVDDIKSLVLKMAAHLDSSQAR